MPDNAPNNANDKIIMGKIARPYGVRGWTKVISFTDPIDNLLNYSVWEIKHNNQWQSIKLEKGKVHGKALIVKLAGCDAPEVVKKYTNDLVAILHEQLPQPKTNEYYWADLMGLAVINTQGVRLGYIDSLMETGANDVIVTKDQDGKQILIPYIPSVVISIDLAKKTMVVDWDDSV